MSAIHYLAALSPTLPLSSFTSSKLKLQFIAFVVFNTFSLNGFTRIQQASAKLKDFLIKTLAWCLEILFSP